MCALNVEALERSSVTEIDARNAKGARLHRKKRYWKCVLTKGCSMVRRLCLRGKADEAPDTITGDVIFVLQLKEHPKFKQKFDDLYVEHTLTLTEALCGFQFAITHLDGRQLLIKSNPGEVIKPDQYKAINDEGMPHYKRPFIKGRLFIHFNVDFPDLGFLSPEKCRSLETILPVKPNKHSSNMLSDDCEEAILHDVNIEDETRRKQQRPQEAYNEDNDDDEPNMPRMACNQQ